MNSNTERNLPEPQKSFLLEEQKQRRAEIDTLVARLDADHRYGVLAIGVIWSWLATNRSAVEVPFLPFVAALPALITAFHMVRARILDGQIHRAASYTRELETLFGLGLLDPRLGWETWLRDRGSHTFKNSFGRLAEWWWWLILCLNIALGVAYVHFGWTHRILQNAAG